jgi:hypothetical protein
MSESDTEANPLPGLNLPKGGAPWNLKRVEHYALIMLNSMAAGGSAGLSDGDIDFAIDVAERLAKKLAERGHIQSHE